MVQPQRLVVGITGATGIIFGVRLLELLRDTPIETHLIVSKAADRTRAHELALSARDLRALAGVDYAINDVGAALASGSFRTLGMIIAPCSVKTLAEIASGVSSSLLTRAADVTLKERRRLVLMVRETPLSAIHLRNMLTVTEAGAIVMPPVPALYTLPKSLDDMVTHTVCRALDLFDIDVGRLQRWGEDIDVRAARAKTDDTP
ncbi:MAG: UbiX family flavin prenyltransferase [Gammaproteobacteria bacterium]|nr:UbiX family flavin prenyltransferase [Gammaproteobacteria bacterium]